MPQFRIAAITGTKVFPLRVRRYSTLGGTRPLVDALVELFAERRKGMEGVVSSTVSTILGRPATRFDDFAARHADVFRGERPAPAR